MMRKKLLAIAITAALLNTGCGDSSSDDTATPISGVSLSGVAAKGIINGGLVTAYELTITGTVKAEIGSATTAADGSYAITPSSNYTGGPIQIVVTAGPNTLMKCDASSLSNCGTYLAGDTNIANGNGDTVIDRGEWFNPGAITMKAMLGKAASGDKININVTPFTHMATERVMAQVTAGATMDASAVETANTEVSVLLGVDVQRTSPVDVTDPAAVANADPRALAYAAMAATLMDVASQDLDGDNQADGMASVLTRLATAFSDGSMIIKDEVNPTGEFTLKNITDHVTAQYGDMGTTDTSNLTTNLVAKVTAAVEDAVDDPVVTPVANVDGLVKVKEFVNDFRTWGTVIEAESNGSGQLFSNELDMANAVFGNGSSESGQWLDLTMQVMLSAADAGLTDLNSITDRTYGSGYTSCAPVGCTLVYGPAVTATGTMSITPNSDSTVTLTLASGTLSYVDSGGTEVQSTISNFSITMPAPTGETTTLVAAIKGTVEGAYDKMVIANGSTATMTLSSPIDSAALYAGTASPAISSVDFALDVAMSNKVIPVYSAPDQFGNTTITGSTAATDPVTFAGKLALSNVGMGTYINEWGQTEPAPSGTGITASGNFSNSTNSFDASVTATVSGLTFADAPMTVGSIYEVGTLTYNVTGDQLVASSLIANATLTWLPDASGPGVPGVSVSVTYSDASTQNYQAGVYRGETSLSQWVVNNAYAIALQGDSINGYNLNAGDSGYWIPGTTDLGVSGTISGTLQWTNNSGGDVIDTATSWTNVELGLTLTAQLNNVPQAQFTFTGNRTAFDAGTAIMTISYGQRSISVDGSTSAGSGTGSITVTNLAGVAFTMNNFSQDTAGSVSGMVQYNGQTYGTLSTTPLGTKLTYTDGFFDYL